MQLRQRKVKRFLGQRDMDDLYEGLILYCRDECSAGKPRKDPNQHLNKGIDLGEDRFWHTLWQCGNVAETAAPAWFFL